MHQNLGNDLNLGQISGTSRSLTLSKEARRTHLYVSGSTGTGKSKFLENLICQDIWNWRNSKCGMLVLDPHGSLYDSVIRWQAWKKIDRPIIPIDLRQDDWIVSYDVLRQRGKKSDPAVVINNFVQAMAYVWGASGTHDTPLFARWASNILWTLYEKKQTLLEAEYLLDLIGKQKRFALTENLSPPSLAQAWAYANTLTPKEYEAQISSTLNRLRTFLSTRMLRQIFGQGGQSLDLSKALDEGHIILVNLATERGRVSDEDSSLLATLLLSDLWATAKERGKSENIKPFYVYIDEFQNFITPTIAKNLDQARGFGLHLTLANQFPRQILHAGAQGAQVYDSVMANALSKVIFETRGEENLRPLALDLFMGVMNPEEIKHRLYSTKVMKYREELKTSYSEGTSSSKGYGTQHGSNVGSGNGKGRSFYGDDIFDEPRSSNDSESEFSGTSESMSESWMTGTSQSKTISSSLVPILGKELSHVQFRSLEEQVFRAMAVLFDQQQRHSVARLAGMRAPVSIRIPTVNQMPGSEARIQAFLDRCYEKLPFAFRQADAEKQLSDRAKNFSDSISDGIAEQSAKIKRRIR